MKIENNQETSLSCPKCGPDTHLIVKTNSVNGKPFLGCPNWPECKFTREIPEEWKMRAAGQMELFVFKE